MARQGTAIHVEGLDEFLRGLRIVDPSSGKEMRKAHRKISNHTQAAARRNASAAAGPFGARFADARTAIKAYASEKEAAIGVSRSGRVPHAEATFWGAKGRSGWYGRAKYAASTGQQHPEWVGENWDAGVPGQGPYVLNYTVAEEMDRNLETYGEAMDDLFARAFPDPI
jgi:hypothetical protein